MKKIVILLVAFFGLALFSVFSKPVYSQEITPVSDEYRNAQSAYQKTYSDYVAARDDYILKRSQYLSYKTLKSQTDAYDATSKFIRLRDDVYLQYMNVLTIRLKEAKGIPDERKAGLQARIDQETLWYTTHRDSIPSAGTLDDLVKDSNDAKGHVQISHLLYYEILVYVADGQVTDFRDRTKIFLDEIKKLVDVIKADQSEDAFSTEKLALIDRWIFDSESKIVRAEQKMQEGLDQIVKLTETRNEGQLREFNKNIAVYTEAAISLKEANAFLGEDMNEIKRAD
jgi:hypothetical protein